MLSRELIADLLPHKGASVLLDSVAAWSAQELTAQTRSHLAPGNPLRRNGRLEMICGIEYGLQAAALHGALSNDSTPQPAGFLASIRDVRLRAPFLDEPAYGELRIVARLDHAGRGGMIYTLGLTAEDGVPLLDGVATIALPAAQP